MAEEIFENAKLAFFRNIRGLPEEALNSF